MNRILRIIAWNANGLVQRKQELDDFLHNENIDIALVSEIHFTPWTVLKIRNYNIYTTLHPSGKARGGTAIFIKESIKHFELEEHSQLYLQATTVRVNDGNNDLTVTAIYCPPQGGADETKFTDFFRKLGNRFIVGGDYNAKHTHWGSRLITQKGRALFKTINTINAGTISTRKPTYWPTDPNKIPDLLDFFVVKNISPNYVEVEGLIELSSDHIPVLLSLSSNVIMKERKIFLTNKRTDWDLFRTTLEETTTLSVKLKTPSDIEVVVQKLTKDITEAIKVATPIIPGGNNREITYPLEIRELVQQKRKARRTWHRTRHPEDKTNWNRISKILRDKINEMKNETFKSYLSGLSATDDTDYSLWKATRRIKRPHTHVPPIRKIDGTWARSEQDKAEVYAQYLENVFQPNDIASELDVIQCLPLNEIREKIRFFTPLEVAHEIDNNINPKKAPGFDEISPRILKELPKKTIILLTHIYNAILRLESFPMQWKKAQVIMLLKPGKPPEQATSYRPISLLPSMSKLFEKLLLKRLKPLIEARHLIPDHQFGFRNKHSTIEQVHQVTNVISKAFEEKKYCCGVFLDVAQAFDKVWHKGLLIKLREQLPHTWCALLESYLTERQFRVVHEEAITSWKNTLAGVPQGSVLGPILYLLYTADIPTNGNSMTAMFADDTAILATSSNQQTATENVQASINHISNWTRKWKIKINKDKSMHVNYTLRKTENLRILLDDTSIPQKDSVKYLGMHLDSRLNWKHHVRQKKLQIQEKMRKLYWLVGRRSTLDLTSKRLLYIAIIKPIWTYGIQLWGCASKSNIEVIQRCQNIALRTIVAAYRYDRNEIIHRDLNISSIQDEIKKFANKHAKKLELHPNASAKQLLDNSQDIRRLKRLKPYDLV